MRKLVHCSISLHFSARFPCSPLSSYIFLLGLSIHDHFKLLDLICRFCAPLVSPENVVVFLHFQLYKQIEKIQKNDNIILEMTACFPLFASGNPKQRNVNRHSNNNQMRTWRCIVFDLHSNTKPIWRMKTMDSRCVRRWWWCVSHIVLKIIEEMTNK